MSARFSTFLAAASTALLAFPALADAPLPAPSPSASVTQRVGITDVTVDYSSPGVKGRKIFGDVVPFGQLWRLGANAATKLTVSRDATLAGTPLPAGSYSLFAIPTEKSWTLIVNKNPNLAGTSGYDPKLDLVRFEATPVAIPARERMTFIFSDTTDTATRLDLEWGESRVSFPITVDTQNQALAGIQQHVDASWQAFANAARYEAEAGRLDPAKRLVNASLAIKQTWFNTWIKAQIFAKAKDMKQAYALAQEAYKLGKDDPGFFYKGAVEQALKDWKGKR